MSKRHKSRRDKSQDGVFQTYLLPSMLCIGIILFLYYGLTALYHNLQLTGFGYGDDKLHEIDERIEPGTYISSTSNKQRPLIIYNYGDLPLENGSSYYKPLSTESVRQVLSFYGHDNHDNTHNLMTNEEQQNYCNYVEKQSREDEKMVYGILQRDKSATRNKRGGKKIGSDVKMDHLHHNDVELLIESYISHHHVHSLYPYNEHNDDKGESKASRPITGELSEGYLNNKKDVDLCISSRSFVIGSYSCPTQIGNRMHELLNAFAGAIITNRTLLIKSCDRTTRCGSDMKVCDSILRRQAWLPSANVILGRLARGGCLAPHYQFNNNNNNNNNNKLRRVSRNANASHLMYVKETTTVPPPSIIDASIHYSLPTVIPLQHHVKHGEGILACCGIDVLPDRVLDFGVLERYEMASLGTLGLRVGSNLGPLARERALRLFARGEEYAYGLMWRYLFHWTKRMLTWSYESKTRLISLTGDQHIPLENDDGDGHHHHFRRQLAQLGPKDKKTKGRRGSGGTAAGIKGRRPMNKKDAYVNANTVATHRNEMKAERLKRREEKGRVEKNKSGKDGYDMSQKGKEDKRPHTNKGSKSATAGRNSYSATEAAANDGDLGEPVANLGLRAPRVGGKTAGKGVGVKGETRRTSPQTPVQPAVEVYDEKSAMGDSPAGSAARQVDLRYNKTAAYEYMLAQKKLPLAGIQTAASTGKQIKLRDGIGASHQPGYVPPAGGEGGGKESQRGRDVDATITTDSQSEQGAMGDFQGADRGMFVLALHVRHFDRHDQGDRDKRGEMRCIDHMLSMHVQGYKERLQRVEQPRRSLSVAVDDSDGDTGVGRSRPLQGAAGLSRPFPAHWGEPPLIQTKDLRELPGEYGRGSSTLAQWIAEKMRRDRDGDKDTNEDGRVDVKETASANGTAFFLPCTILLATDRTAAQLRLTRDLRERGCHVIIADHRPDSINQNTTKIYGALQRSSFSKSGQRRLELGQQEEEDGEDGEDGSRRQLIGYTKEKRRQKKDAMGPRPKATTGVRTRVVDYNQPQEPTSRRRPDPTEGRKEGAPPGPPATEEERVRRERYGMASDGQRPGVLPGSGPSQGGKRADGKKLSPAQMQQRQQNKLLQTQAGFSQGVLGSNQGAMGSIKRNKVIDSSGRGKTIHRDRDKEREGRERRDANAYHGDHGPWRDSIASIADIELLSYADAFIGTASEGSGVPGELGGPRMLSTYSMLIAAMIRTNHKHRHLVPPMPTSGSDSPDGKAEGVFDSAAYIQWLPHCQANIRKSSYAYYNTAPTPPKGDDRNVSQPPEVSGIAVQKEHLSSSSMNDEHDKGASGDISDNDLHMRTTPQRVLREQLLETNRGNGNGNYDAIYCPKVFTWGPVCQGYRGSDGGGGEGDLQVCSRSRVPW